MKTKEVVDKTGIERETLRFYESKGLLPKTNRNNAGHRIYPDNTIVRIEFISKAKHAGFTLREIKDLIDLKNKKKSCRSGRDVALLKKKQITDQMKALKEMNAILERFIKACEKNGESGLSNPCHFSFEECCS